MMSSSNPSAAAFANHIPFPIAFATSLFFIDATVPRDPESCWVKPCVEDDIVNCSYNGWCLFTFLRRIVLDCIL